MKFLILGIFIGWVLFSCASPVNQTNVYYHVEDLNGYDIANIPVNASVVTIQDYLELDFETDAYIIKQYFNKETEFFMWNDLNFWRVVK